MNKESNYLSNLVDSLQARGNYFLFKSAAKEQLNVTEDALKSSIKRLTRKKRLVRLKDGLYLIVPVEYKNVGAPPPEWFVDQLMNAYKAKYYVGLLTAAALHGAAHQQPQIYQVVTDKILRPIKVGRVRIVFYFKKDFKDIGIIKRKTSTGSMCVSGPELTAFDLLKYLKQSGYIHHISTVLAELGEEIDSKKLAEIAVECSQGCIQRTGYILDYVDFRNKTKELLKYVQKLPSKYYPLRPDKEWNPEIKNKDWHLYINEELEPDI